MSPNITSVQLHSNDTADVSVRCFDGAIRTMTLPITPDQWEAWANGAYIQDALPHLTPAEREFLLTGMTPEEWDEAFAEPEEELPQ